MIQREFTVQIPKTVDPWTGEITYETKTRVAASLSFRGQIWLHCYEGRIGGMELGSLGPFDSEREADQALIEKLGSSQPDLYEISESVILDRDPLRE